MGLPCGAFVLVSLLHVSSWTTIASFTIQGAPQKSISFSSVKLSLHAVRRYGPLPGENEGNDSSSVPSNSERERDYKKQEFRRLLDQLVDVKKPEHMPSLLTSKVDLILELSNEEGARLIGSILDDVAKEKGEEAKLVYMLASELAISFLEGFVEETRKLDDKHKNLLGKIVLLLADRGISDRSKEEALDKLMQKESDQFTEGFVRHLLAECDRIRSAPKMTPDSARLLEILQIIQVRVREEIGKSLDEATRELGNLINYATTTERLSILDAKLTIHGLDFARQMLASTEESLVGFRRMADEAHAEIVERIVEIRDHTKDFISRAEGFQ